MSDLKELNNKLKEANKNNSKLLEKYVLISKLLDDEKCFFKLDIETAYSILRDLGIKENNIKEIYMNLIDIKNY